MPPSNDPKSADPAATDTADQADASAPAVEIPAGHVTARILPKGDGQVFTGEHDHVANLAKTFARGDQVVLHRTIAEELEDRGFVEIL